MKILFLTCFTTIAVNVSAGWAVNLVVSTSEDEFDTPSGNSLSLREALRDASSNGDTILFDPGLSGARILLTKQLETSKSITIDASALDEILTIDADGENTRSRVLEVHSQGMVVLDSLVITGGRPTLTVPGHPQHGGGILNRGILRLESCQVVNNGTTAVPDGPSGSGGGIWNSGSLEIEGSLIAGNSISAPLQGYAGDGGGIYCFEGNLTINNSQISANIAGSPGGAGGGIWMLGNILTITDCLVDRNRSGDGWTLGGGDGGGIWCHGTLLIDRCTIAENKTGNGFTFGSLPQTHGGSGGGVWAGSGNPITVSNSTIAYNSASGRIEGGRGGSGGGLCIESDSKVTHCTIVGNTAETVGGCLSTGSLTLTNSIITSNSDESGSSDVSGNVVTSGLNLLSTLTGSELETSNILQLVADPRLGPLGNHGGPVPTLAVLPGSPVIDAAAPLSTPPSTDQRGLARDSTPDIGAIEYLGKTDLARYWISDWDLDGSPFGVEYALGSDPLAAQSTPIPIVLSLSSGLPTLSFEIIGNPVDGVEWIFWRSSDLVSFNEIYRSSTPVLIDGRVFVTDPEEMDSQAVYQFEARLAP